MEHRRAIELARRYVLIDRGERALEALKNASPAVAESWLWRANALHQLDRYEEAIDSAERGLAIEPESSYLRQAVARAQLMLGHLAEAEVAILAALRLQPEEPEALAMHASILTSLGRSQEAKEVIRRATELAPELRSVRLLRAMLTEPLDGEEAIRISRELLEAEPEGATEHWWHAMNCVRRGRLRDAADHYARASALDPANAMFARAARLSRHWFFWPLRATSPVLYWLGKF